MQKCNQIDFIGIGAQKSGTSWLFQQFRKSSQFSLPPKKELHFFSKDAKYPSPNMLLKRKLINRVGNPLWFHEVFMKFTKYKSQRDWFSKWYFSEYTDEWYISLFENFTKCSGEITPAYAILDEEDVSKMSKLIGADTKIIYILRHPVDRAWSSYKFKYKLKKISDFDKEHFFKYIHSNEHQLRSDYLRTIRIYKKYFNSICVSFFDAIEDHPKSLLSHIFEYLELDTSEVKNLINAEKKINSTQNIQLPEEIANELYAIYEDSINELAKLYGGRFNSWKRQHESQKQECKEYKPGFVIKG